MSASDQAISTDVINAFFQSAGIQRQWTLPVNDEVAVVFARMLDEVRKCSDAVSWVPKPTGRPSVSWLVRQLGRGFISQIKGKTSLTCARYAVNAYITKMTLAAQGF